MMQILEVGSQIETCVMPDEDLNGLKGHIVCYNASSLRYTLELENGDMMSLQGKNIKAAAATNDKVINTSTNPRAKDDPNESAPSSNVLNLVNSINEKLHQKPFDMIAEGLYWCFILCFVGVPGSIIALFLTVYNVYMHYLGTPDEEKNVMGYNITASTPATATDSKKKAKTNKQLGVVITGCDSGFGKDLALQLLESNQGFVVFCGCLLDESVEQFKQTKHKGTAIPIKMDVTNDAQVQSAAKVVNDWLLEGNSSKEEEEEEERHLLALVNNAGIGIGGLVDWLEVSDFQKVFDINYFGVIRCVKAFQPIFKGQATALEEETKKSKKAGSYKYYPDARIINVISVAGIFAPGQYGNAYCSSKHALEAFTNNLRQEMSMFGVKVIGIHPGLHNTAIVRGAKLRHQSIVDRIPQEKRDEYGEVFLNAFLNRKIPTGFDHMMVVQTIANVIIEKNPPIKNLIGSDAKFLFHICSKMPTWLCYGIVDKLLKISLKSEEEYIPKIMMDKKKKEQQQQPQKMEGEESSQKKDQ